MLILYINFKFCQIFECFFGNVQKTDSPIVMNQSFVMLIIINYFSFLIAAWAAASLATGTLYGEQDT